MGDEPLGQRMVLQWARRVNLVLSTGSLAALIVIVTRAFGGAAEVTLWELPPIPLTRAWFVFAAGTIIHAFAGLFLRSTTIEFQQSPAPRSSKVQAYENVVAEGGLFVGVAVRRLPEPGSRFLKMSWRDPSTWVSHLGALALFVAVMPWYWDVGLKWAGGTSRYALVFVALGLPLINWLIGSQWALALSDLGDGEQTIFLRWLASSGGQPGRGSELFVVLTVFLAAVSLPAAGIWWLVTR